MDDSKKKELIEKFNEFYSLIHNTYSSRIKQTYPKVCLISEAEIIMRVELEVYLEVVTETGKYTESDLPSKQQDFDAQFEYSKAFLASTGQSFFTEPDLCDHCGRAYLPDHHNSNLCEGCAIEMETKHFFRHPND